MRRAFIYSARCHRAVWCVRNNVLQERVPSIFKGKTAVRWCRRCYYQMSVCV